MVRNTGILAVMMAVVIPGQKTWRPLFGRRVTHRPQNINKQTAERNASSPYPNRRTGSPLPSTPMCFLTQLDWFYTIQGSLIEIEAGLDRYQRIYADLEFERAGLFETVQKKYGCMTALYPGSSIHITPSFSIPHVVYVDRQPETAAFFDRLEAVKEFVDRHKKYRRSAYIQFIAADYTQPLPLPESSFDLLIELFSGSSAAACARYLRPGGLLLTNQPYQRAPDAGEIGFHSDGVIRYQRGAYRIISEDLGEKESRNRTANRRYLKQQGEGLVYQEQEAYFLFIRG